MYCPECKGKTRVSNTLPSVDFNEIYRRRVCKECGHSFYTIESIHPVKGAFRIALAKATEARAKGGKKKEC